MPHETAELAMPSDACPRHNAKHAQTTQVSHCLCSNSQLSLKTRRSRAQTSEERASSERSSYFAVSAAENEQETRTKALRRKGGSEALLLQRAHCAAGDLPL
jgi:hypothetical protein